MNIIEKFKASVVKYPDRAALIDLDGQRSITYSELDSLSGKVAGKLASLGLKQGDFVVIGIERRMEYIAAYFGILKLGCVVVPVVSDYPRERIEYIKNNCRAAYTITIGFFDDIEKYREIDAHVDGNSPALLIYTSGSTGNPKGILHSTADLARAAERPTRFVEGMDRIEYVSAASMAFIVHTWEYLAMLSFGATVHILSDEKRRDVNKLVEYIDEVGANVTFFSPQMLRLMGEPPKSIERAITGSERLSQFYSEKFRLFNVYGMSEVTHCCAFEVDRSYVNTPVGYGLPGVEIQICGDDGRILPPGDEGEICFCGTFDSRYFNDPERTAKVFRKLPDGRTRVYTGDIGYMDPDGRVVYINRKDWMVKINGQRVETLEIERLLLDMPEVDNAAVKAFEDSDGQTYIAAYYSEKSKISGDSLRARLEEKLPAYMIPRFFVRMDALPKNLNGKLDRKSLMPPDAQDFKETYKAPVNLTEATLCRAFEETLKCGKVGTLDNFISLGGDSIKVLKLIQNADIPGLSPDMILRGKTPAGICRLIGEGKKTETVHSEEIPKVCRLTEAQMGVYLECMESPDSVMYNIPVLCRMPEGTDAKKLADAVLKVAECHKALNVNIGAPDGVPSMIYNRSTPEITVKEIDDIKAECRDFIRPFDLGRDKLYRFEILRESDRVYLLFDIHHIIFDGTSVENLVSEIAGCYDGGEVSPELLTQFDISKAEEDLPDSAEYAEAKEFFARKFDGVDCDAKPISDRVADEKLTGAGRVIINARDNFSAKAVSHFTQKHRITENTLFLGAFACALAIFNGTDDSFFCTVNNGRHDPRLASSIGMFVKTLPLYCNIDRRMKITDFLQNTQNYFFDTMSHDCMPFGELAAEYGVNTDVVFIYQAEIFGGAQTEDGEISVESLDSGDAQSDLDVMMLKEADGYKLMAHFRNAVYSEELIRGFARLYLNVIKQMLSVGTLADINPTDAVSFAQIRDFNKTEYKYENKKTVVELFREQAVRTPENICLVYENKSFTYREIDRITDILAKHLKGLGVGREKIVGVLIPRCEYMLICALGVLKAGGAYLPLDPTYPPERLNLMMRDSGAMMLIYDKTLENVITQDCECIRMTTDEIPALEDSDVKLKNPGLSDLFVMLYTSGSTGTPKGVMFQHSNTLVTTEWVKKYFEIDQTSRMTLYASFGFDAHTFDMYPAITSGAQLHIISDEIRLDFIALRDYFNKNRITHTVMTTQVGRQFALLGGLETLEHLSVAGEKLTPPDVPEGFRMYNLYGPTEGSVVTSAFLIDKKYKDVPIGKAVDNLKAYVVDKYGKLLPAGAVGELWISGPHVTRGYLNRPEKTAEAYGQNSFESIPGYERIYKTGDVVRYLPDGNMQFVGRRDAQVKVRGFRVELTEVEEIIRRYPGIKDATVTAFDENGGGKYLAAYVVTDESVDIGGIGDFIRAEKPPYMVPAVIMKIDKIPLNQNQKVNKRALPIPERKAFDLTKPENETQKRIFGIVAEVIGNESFGINTDIFDAGLTSIGVVKLNMLLAEEFGVSVRVADVKMHPTVRMLEELIAGSKIQDEYEILTDYPISQTQNGIFVECMANPGSTIYNIPVLIKLGEKVDTDKLAQAIKTALDAHPYVKTVLRSDESGNIRAVRRDQADVTVSVMNCEKLPEASGLIRPFELIGQPLYRIEIYKTQNGNYLFMDFHHMISDGTSEQILFADITSAYDGYTVAPEKYTGFEAALDDMKLRESKEREVAAEYWKKTLSGAETECMPKPEPEDKTGAGVVRYTDKCDTKAVMDFCESHNLTLNAYFNSVFAFVLSRFAGKDSVSYSTVHNGRGDSRCARTFTMLVKTVPVVANIDGDEDVDKFIDKTKAQLVGGMSNDACSFAELSSQYGVKADLLFVYQGSDFKFDTLCGQPAELMDLCGDTAKAPLSVNLFVTDEGFAYTAEYRKDTYGNAFAEAFVTAMAAASRSFLTAGKIKNVTMLSPESDRLYSILNNSQIEILPLTSVDLLEKVAAERPDKPAVTADGKTLTYKELNQNANKVAHALIKEGIGRDDIVGIVLERSCDIPMCQVAIQKAGGAFMAALPGYPDDRIEYCLRDAQIRAVLTTDAIKHARRELFADDKPYKTLTIESLLNVTDTENPEVEILPEQLAYCIYTSGSTGNPKGVMIEHGNLSNLIQTFRKTFAFYRDGCDGCAMSCCSVSFDASVMDIFLALCTGSHLYMTTDEEYHNPMLLKEVILKNRVRHMIGTPSYVTNLANTPEFAPVFAQFASMLVGAEAFPRPLFDALRKNAPNLQIINGYGPTECTVCSSFKELRSSTGITIGRSSGNFKHFVMDKFGNILPPYASGELIITGSGVGRGYVDLPEKTAASFFTLNGERAYHSGDFARINGNGEIDFIGRIDNQVKLRGFRVELDEIEKVMCEYPGVKQSKVIVRNNGNEDYLAGFFTASKEIPLDELTAFMKSKLTYYMVPAVMMQLESMPLTQNGKIDKKALPEIKQAKKERAGKRAAKKSLEQSLCEIYGNILGMNDVYADDNFFELGGTSLTASKVTMLLMSEGIQVKYGDIFDHPTPEELAEFIEKHDGASKPTEEAVISENKSLTRETLKYNTVKYAAEVKRQPLGNVLLTGAVGFLGIHLLKELLDIESGHIYCLVRKGSHDTAEIRLKTMLIYYFGRGFDKELRDRITVIDADITDPDLYAVLSEYKIDTVINSAACVKHFSDTNILDEINVHGVANLISVCRLIGAKLIQISTVSIPGMHTAESYEKQVRMYENQLFVIDDMDNKYVISKYRAENLMFDAIDEGLCGKVIRVGNLMGRHSDGEFQANMETNMFMSGLRGFAIMGKYPISHMTDPMSFSPVDCTARAVVLLSGTNDKFTAFNANSRYGFDEMKIIDACNKNGITIYPEQDEIYYKEFREKLGDDRVNSRLNGLAAYDVKDAHAVETDNLFTTNILYRIGFSWPLIDDTYLERAINSVMTLDYFNPADDDE